MSTQNPFKVAAESALAVFMAAAIGAALSGYSINVSSEAFVSMFALLVILAAVWAGMAGSR